jgi:hypothetical protein
MHYYLHFTGGQSKFQRERKKGRKVEKKGENGGKQAAFLV